MPVDGCACLRGSAGNDLGGEGKLWAMLTSPAIVVNWDFKVLTWFNCGCLGTRSPAIGIYDSELAGIGNVTCIQSGSLSSLFSNFIILL